MRVAHFLDGSPRLPIDVAPTPLLHAECAGAAILYPER